MFVTSSIKEANAFRKKNITCSLGFVPTMGFLHEGHLSLVKRSLDENQKTVVSIFVNPTQFNRKEDLESYPMDLDKDLSLLKKAGVDMVFTPTVAAMYPKGFSTKVMLGGITAELEGASRPRHFDGVTQVVSKFFNIIGPERAYFGMKDYQQLQVIKKMVEDLNFPIEVVSCPTTREKNGLAMSSRNVRLNEEEKKQAVVLYQALKWAKDNATKGMTAKTLQEKMQSIIESVPLAKVEYISCNHARTLTEITLLESDVLVSLAVFFGDVRLIDNQVLNLG